MITYPRTKPTKPLSRAARIEAMKASIVTSTCKHLPNARAVCRRCGAMYYSRLDYWDAPLKRPSQALWRVIPGGAT